MSVKNHKTQVYRSQSHRESTNEQEESKTSRESDVPHLLPNRRDLYSSINPRTGFPPNPRGTGGSVRIAAAESDLNASKGKPVKDILLAALHFSCTHFVINYKEGILELYGGPPRQCSSMYLRYRFTTHNDEVHWVQTGRATQYETLTPPGARPIIGFMGITGSRKTHRATIDDKVWLLPDGQVIKVPLSHAETAATLLSVSDPQEALKEAFVQGWVRMGQFTNVVYSQVWKFTQPLLVKVQTYVQQHLNGDEIRIEQYSNHKGVEIPLSEFLGYNKVTDLFHEFPYLRTGSKKRFKAKLLQPRTHR